MQGSKKLWVKTSIRKSVNKLKIDPNNVRTLLRDEQIQELEEELIETRLGRDVIAIG